MLNYEINKINYKYSSYNFNLIKNIEKWFYGIISKYYT